MGAAKAKGDEAEFERLRALAADKKAEVARLNDEAKKKTRLEFDVAANVMYTRPRRERR
ncbi:hypothetical protein [Antarctobacter sp.]|uniref:hypothetical protein n=1 Tax=Antarctobacter sp. TaxID=1872577 RepID=UPI003A8D89AA